MAKSISRAFKDRPMTPFETAMYWIEYIGRNHGAPHLKPAGNRLYLFQYLMLDVISIIIISFYLVVRCCKWLCGVIFSQSSKQAPVLEEIKRKEKNQPKETKLEYNKKLETTKYEEKPLKKRKPAAKAD